jgi:hypothetical protein
LSGLVLSPTHTFFECRLSQLGPIIGQPALDMEGAYRIILDQMHAHNCKRLICMSTYSNKDPQDRFAILPWLMILSVWIIAHSAWSSIVNTAKLIREEGPKYGIEWTMPRVAMLGMQENQKLSVGYIGDGQIGCFLSRHNMAAFFVDQLESREYINKQPAISTTAQ